MRFPLQSPPKLRIAQVNDIACVGSTLVTALQQLGQSAELLEVPRPGASWPTPWRELTAPLRLISNLAVVPRLRQGPFDVVHFHYAWKATAGLFAGRPFVLHCHGSDVRGRTPREPLGHLIELIAARAGRVYYSTPDLASTVRAFRGDAEFLPNPIDLARFGPGPDSRAEPTRDVLIPVRLDPIKGLDTIVAVVERLLELRPETSFTVIDQGPGIDRVRSAARGRVTVRTPVRHTAVPDLFREHRLVLGQFRVGALGNTELEALACGVPVAAAFRFPEAYASPPPLVAGGSDDPETVAHGLGAVLDDDRARTALAEASSAWIAATHDAPTIGARLIEAYREIAGATTAP